MLVLSRKLNQEIRISDDIVVRVIGIKGNQVRLGIVAPDDVSILREEILTKVPPVPHLHGSRSRVMKCARC
jgi:carbon storage regulator